MSAVNIKNQRKYLPHLLLHRSAERSLAAAKERKLGFYYDCFQSILCSSLCIEAIGNTYGKILIPDWKEQVAERIKQKLGASPTWKLHAVANWCGINSDVINEPWHTARKLGGFRDLIAHATQKELQEETQYDMSNYLEATFTRLESELEEMVTEEFAIQSYEAISRILEMFNKDRTDKELYHLVMDGMGFSAQAIEA